MGKHPQFRPIRKFGSQLHHQVIEEFHHRIPTRKVPTLAR